MSKVTNAELRELAEKGDLQARLGATISGGHTDGLLGEVLACQVVGGTTVEQKLGQDKHRDLDILAVANSSINTAAVATRITDLLPESFSANGTEATRAGLIASAQGSDPDRGPALDPTVDLLVVDAFDKMKSDHRTAFTEVLDTRSYSITTANIQESLSGSGANLLLGQPKYGQFDEHEPYGGQIDYEPEIINAVDVVLAITGSGNRDVEPLEPEVAQSVIEQARAINPAWSDSATDALSDKNDMLRKQEENEDVILGVNPGRAREAVRKLSEATAKLRFSETVSNADVSDAWGVYKRAYQTVGVLGELEEVGEFDPKVVSVETEDHQDRIRGIINDIESEYDEGAPVDVVIERGVEVGIDGSKVEHEIEQLKQKGKVYEPRTDHLRTC